jgi:hypothetical protein
MIGQVRQVVMSLSVLDYAATPAAHLSILKVRVWLAPSSILGIFEPRPFRAAAPWEKAGSSQPPEAGGSSTSEGSQLWKPEGWQIRRRAAFVA